MLYVIPTPIGNLEDLTLRALRILQSVDVIVAEDTRHTSKLLSHYQIHKPLLSYHEHSPPARLAELITLLQSGKTLGLVSDAGMPGISDPGTGIIQACWEARIPLEVLPGANACLTALVSAGFADQRFTFEGFLPVQGASRQERLAQLIREERVLIFYEAPHRIQQTLQDLGHWLGLDRELAVCRELTKIHSQVWRGTIQGAIEHFQQPRGEFTLVIRGCLPANEVIDDNFLIQQLQMLVAQGLVPSAAVRLLAQQTGVGRKHIYQLALTEAQHGAQD